MSDYTMMNSDTLGCGVAGHKTLGHAYVDDGYGVKYSKEEINRINENGGITKNMNLVRAVFKGEVFFETTKRLSARCNSTDKTTL